MNLAQEIQATFDSTEHRQASDVLTLLDNEGTVTKVSAQGDSIMIEYNPAPRDLSCITKDLYNKHKLVISGYDVKPTIGSDKIRLWLRPISTF